MAKLTSLFSFQGSLEGISVYHMEGVKQPIVRKKGGPSKKRIKTDPAFAGTRRNIQEFSGRGKAAGLVMDSFPSLKHLADFNTAGKLNSLLLTVQKMDTENAWGRRSIELSRAPWLLEGFPLTKNRPFESVVRTPISHILDREGLSSNVELPALLHGVNFLPLQGYPLYRVVATLGVVPDLFYTPGQEGYAPKESFRTLLPAEATTSWRPVKSNAPASVLELHLTGVPGNQNFSLVLTVGIEWGTMGASGDPEWVRKKGSARIVATG